MSKSPVSKRGEVRIIGGLHRSRKIHFPDVPGLRPTPNRIRETLFNWLAPVLPGARCLDLFAGSGALGFEAISRGATYCLMLDSSKEIVAALIENKLQLNLSNVDICQANFPYQETFCEQPFDIIFIDPPFHKDFIPKVFAWLKDSSCLKVGTNIYVESESEEDVLLLPNGWLIKKDKTAGNVRYSLIEISVP